jgi:ketosteroid isomerase-like protein
MASNKDALKERCQKFSQGDLEGALDLWTDDFVWEGANASDLPGSGRHEGNRQAIQALQQAVGSYDTFALTPDESFEEGDTVVVLGHTEVSKGDRSAKTPVVHIWRFDGDGDGNATRLQILTDTYENAKVLGMA